MLCAEKLRKKSVKELELLHKPTLVPHLLLVRSFAALLYRNPDLARGDL